MKKISFIVLIAIMLSAVMPISASAFLGKRDVVVNGYALSGGAIDKYNHTFVPFRELFTELGLTVRYDAKSKKVTGTKGKQNVTFTIGSKTATINGQKKTLQVAPFNSKGSVYVPLRVVSEATGSSITYIKNIDVVLVNGPDFNGITYSSPNGDIKITKDGDLYSTSNLALVDFLSFVRPDEESRFQGVSLQEGVTLTPDVELIPVEEEPVVDPDQELLDMIERLEKKYEEDLQNYQ